MNEEGMHELQEHGPEHTSLFAQIRHETDDGFEYWSARDLAKALGYEDYRNFVNVIQKARIACENSGQAVEDHFVDVTDMIPIGKGGKRKVANVHLSRYACYLIVQNADPEKEVVALGQTYFAVQTAARKRQTNWLASRRSKDASICAGNSRPITASWPMQPTWQESCRRWTLPFSKTMATWAYMEAFAHGRSTSAKG
jgi:hypothetical protein